MPKLCHCGKIVDNVCDCKRRSKQKRSTVAEGHGYDHRVASERYRAEHPLCERCVVLHGVENAQPSEEMHHIHSIKSQPQLRMKRINWLAVCRKCHEDLEGDVMAGMQIKQQSGKHYQWLMGGS